MNLRKQGLSLFLLIFMLVGCSQKQALEWIPFSWEPTTVSGQYFEKAFVYVPVKIEDLPYDFTMQLDLGTYTSLLYGNAIDSYREESAVLAGKLDSTNVWARNMNLQLGTVKFSGLALGYYKNFGEKIPKDSLYTKTPKHVGTIAPDLFKDKTLVIDFKLKRFAVSDSLPVQYKDLPAEKIELNDELMMLPYCINGKECKLLFDTGMSIFQLVTSKERALEISDSIIVDSLTVPSWGKEITLYGLEVNKPIELVGGEVAKGSRVYYAKNGEWDEMYKQLNIWGITGNAYFFDRTVILDYKNKLFRVQ